MHGKLNDGYSYEVNIMLSFVQINVNFVAILHWVCVTVCVPMFVYV